MSANTLRATLEDLARSFASNVLLAIRNASLEEILAETGGFDASAHAAKPARKPVNASTPATRAKRDRLARRTDADLAYLTDKIIALVESRPEGLRAQQIRIALGLAGNELPRPLADALATKRITKRGERRGTTYFPS